MKIETPPSRAVDTVLFARLAKYMQPYWKWILLAVLLLVLAKTAEVIAPLYIGSVIQLTLQTASGDNLHKAEVWNEILRGSLILLGVLVLGYLTEILCVFIRNKIAQKAIFQLRQDVYAHTQALPIHYFDKHPVGGLITRTIHDVDQIHQMFTESLVPILGNLLLVLGIISALFFINWHLGVLFLLILPVIIWQTNQFRAAQRLGYDKTRGLLSSLNTFIQEHLAGVSIIRSFGLQKREQNRFSQMNHTYCTSYLETIKNFSFFVSSIDFLQNLSLIMAFMILVLITPIGPSFNVGNFLTFSLYCLAVFRPLVDLAERYNVLQSAVAASEKVFHLMEQQTEEMFQGIELTEVSQLAFEHVWFAYEAENWVLKDVSFTIAQGESLAVIGVTGSGKSSLINLILRFYEHQRGEILINGRDIRHYSRASLRKHFSTVLQDPVLFSDTIANNIRLGDLNLTDAHLEAIADFVNLRPLLQRLPNGLDEKLQQRGQNLSVGEMQLVALARAVAHERNVLILDEATANIDVPTEKMIQDALKKILQNRTAFVIAHRLTTIQDVKRILVMQSGQIVESGSHEELMSHKGLYEKLYRLQFLSDV